MKLIIEETYHVVRRKSASMNATDGKSSSGSTQATPAVFDPKVIKDFLSDMSFDCNKPPSPDNHDLKAMFVVKLADLGLSHHDLKSTARFHKMSCLYPDLCFPNQPLEFKVFVAVYSFLIIIVDDLFLDSPEIQTFTLKFGRGDPQGDPYLDCLDRLLKFEALKFFGPSMTNLIISSTLDGINAHVIESRFSHGFPRSMSGFSSWLRSKTGYEAYGYFMFSERQFPENEWLGLYIQGLPNLRDVICYINDIMSFYKERVLRSENCLISNLAEENGCDVIAALQSLCARTVAMTYDIRHGYAGHGGSLVKAFDSYMDGYIRWHLSQSRYRLNEIGLRLQEA